MPGTAVTKSVVANDPSGRRREEIFVDIIEKISVTFSSSVSICFSFFSLLYHKKLWKSCQVLFTLPHETVSFCRSTLCIMSLYV